MTNQPTPQWRALVRYLIIAIPTLILLNVLWALVARHRLPAAVATDIPAALLLGLGVFTLVIIVARLRGWPLPGRWGAPSSHPHYEWRLGLLAGVAFFFAALTLLPQVLRR